MDIDLLSRMVKELILDRDKVVLPGLGTFVAEVMPASFSDNGYTINPPYRRLYFRSRTEDDSSLVKLYSASNNISEELAGNILADFLKDLRQVLKEKKLVVFPGLGRLRATKENNFFFVPDEDLDIFPEGFGLQPVSMKTHVETREEVAQAVENLKSIMEIPAEQPAEAAAEPEPEKEIPEILQAEEPARQNGKETIETPVCRKRNIVRILEAAGLSILFIAALLIVFAILAQMFPGIFDGILYNKEQRQILDSICFFTI